MSVRDAVEVDHSPPLFSGGLAVAAGVIAVVSSGFASVFSLGFGILGLAGLVAGVFALDSRALVTVGSGLTFVCVVISGWVGNAPELLLVATIATVLAMDLGQNAVSIGRQMTSDTFTRRGEFVHAAASTVVGVLVATVAYAVYFVATDGQPAGALVFLVLAALFLVWSFRT